MFDLKGVLMIPYVPRCCSLILIGEGWSQLVGPQPLQFPQMAADVYVHR